MRFLPLLILAGCFPSRPCIEPPPSSSQETRDIVLGLSAKFSAIPISPTVEAEFRQAVNVAYQQLNDVNAGYFIALQAAYCFQREGKFGEEIARRILLDLEADWKARNSASLSPPK